MAGWHHLRVGHVLSKLWDQSLGWEGPLEDPTPVFLLGESPWTEEPGGLQSMGLQSWTQLSN